ncbi:MAG: transketolase C-terminal domain-containing protein [Sphaerochaetaceae bacterium]|jgi:transketolase|nr:transketolase C-terminal domain-containing protein [Sphaerochaetaceae bacterium]MDX9939676.1 transketolase C-terminal domain-containing protein [Sphaerochaetaceae bacterium]
MVKRNVETRQNYREGLIKLLELKDSDIRMSILRQGASAIDKGVHIGGAFSAVVPLVSLYYGGAMDYDVQDPTRTDKDLMVLSKGHAVAALASVYADVGYFPPEVLVNSRSHESILNGHPGPILPGVAIATGPLGQGLAVAQGFALYAKNHTSSRVFAVTGDGELQEGIVWEAFMFAPQKRLDNFCVIIDKNHGQLDDHTKLHFSMDGLDRQLEAFGWKVVRVDGTRYNQILNALDDFVNGTPDGRPTVIISETCKGFGAFSAGLDKHKITLANDVLEQELVLQKQRRDAREHAYVQYLAALESAGEQEVAKALEKKRMEIYQGLGSKAISAPVRNGKVPPRQKHIKLTGELPKYGMSDKVMASDVITKCMKLYANDSRVYSVDSDLGSTSGLQSGVGAVDQNRAINVGIAEANMMCIGEAVAANGGNAWVSTFCPFFNWQVMRRIGVSQQERIEAMEDPKNWLSEGHELDLTFVATAANLDTQVNGATHMGNDDNLLFSTIPGLKIIDVSCPNQLVSIIRWIMEGSKGLVYLRIMRSASTALYPAGTQFVYGKAHRIAGAENAKVAIISSGRGSHEALAAAKLLEGQGIAASAYDMPSFDPETIEHLLAHTDTQLLFAEQNNGYLWNACAKLVLDRKIACDVSRLHAVNLNREDGSYRFIHSATYDELTKHSALDATSIAKKGAGLVS